MVTSSAVIPHAGFTLTTNQKRGFLAAWGGWALDGMDAFIYALVLTSALTELLPSSGIAATPVNIGYYGSILGALFLFGWGLSMVWGPIGDRIGRVRALMLTILFYSFFTFLCGFVTNIWQLAVLRVLCGIGIGGEQPVGATYIAEELDERTRKIGAGLMHTGYYFGFFFASLANNFIGANYGWRWMFFFGGLPALMIAFIRYGVHESKKWQEKFGEGQQARPTMAQAFGTLFTARYKRDTFLMSGLFLVSIVMLWAGSILVPTAANQMARAAGSSAADANLMGTYSGYVLAVGTIIGCVLVPFVAESLGRRLSMAIFLTIMGLSSAIGFGYLFYQRRQPAAGFPGLRLLHGAWRRELRQLHHLAARAVHDRLSRQRDRVHQFDRPICRCRIDVPCRLGHQVVRQHRGAGCSGGDGVRVRPHAAAASRRRRRGTCCPPSASAKVESAK